MAKHSKRYREAAARIDRSVDYQPNEAFDMLKSLPAPKFDETVEVAVRLGIDPRKTDQLVRGAVSLPKGLGKTVKVVVFAEGDKVDAAKAAGADEVGSDELAAKIQGGWMDFDVVIASPDMMKHVGKLGKVLGPQGKMPRRRAAPSRRTSRTPSPSSRRARSSSAPTRAATCTRRSASARSRPRTWSRT